MASWDGQARYGEAIGFTTGAERRSSIDPLILGAALVGIAMTMGLVLYLLHRHREKRRAAPRAAKVPRRPPGPEQGDGIA